MEKLKKVFFLILIVLIVSSLFGDGLKNKIQDKINKIEIGDEFKVFVIAMIPIFELRGAIPIGIIGYDLPLWKVIPIAVAGNMIPIFLILLFFDWITRICFKNPFLKKFLESIFARTRKKGKIIEKYEEIGLMLFVAIPLPVTGAWTGSLAAYLFGLRFWTSIFYIFMGVLIAAFIVTILSLLKWIGAIIAVLALTVIVVINLKKTKKESL